MADLYFNLSTFPFPMARTYDFSLEFAWLHVNVEDNIGSEKYQTFSL